MKFSNHPGLKWITLFACIAMIVCLVGVNQLAQTTVQTPAPTGSVNDFAGVLDEQTRQQLGNILENVKLKTGIKFTVAVVKSTDGLDVADFSRQLAEEWKIGARTSRGKSLLLVVAVEQKDSFTRFSKAAQTDLPEGILGEMGQRMRPAITAGRFAEGVNIGVHQFVKSMAEKLALNAEDFDKPAAVAVSAETQVVKPTEEPFVEARAPVKDEPLPKPEEPKTRARTVTVREPTARAPQTATPYVVENPNDESEEVELTLTLPLERRVPELKAFLERRPDSKWRSRAIDLLVSAHAGLGDERLRKGDSGGGIEQMTLAIALSPDNPSERLFTGVISQIPLNLYLRGERDAAISAARKIEEKFGGDAKRLLAIAGFYMGTEQGGEATRIASRAVALAPDLAEAHQALGLGLHISLRLDEAAAEYKRALELDPKSKTARRALADLHRAFGRSEEALAMYRQQLEVEPADKAARAGVIFSLLDLGRADEAKTELDASLKSDPKNLALLAGAAYWFAAHNDFEKALDFGNSALAIEPRYTWLQIAVARSLIAQRKPLEAERAIRFAQQYGKFPTLDYELANALAAASLYDEAAEVLLRSFTIKDGQIETRLAGHIPVRQPGFIELLAPERRASIFQSVSPDTENNARGLKNLLTFAALMSQENVNQESAIAAARDFAAGDDAARVYRQLYAASRLLQKGIGFDTAFELAEAARNSADAGMTVPALTLAVQADEYRDIRARAIAQGGTPDIPDAPRNVMSNLLRGRIEDIAGWSRFNQDKLDEAVDHLKRAVNILPAETPSWRTAVWHLGAALERKDNKEEALANYIKSYNTGDPDPARRTVIENLYRKMNGSLAGLDERIRGTGSGVVEQPVESGAPAQPTTSPEILPAASPSVETSAPSAPVAEAAPKVEVSATPSPEATPEVVPTPTPESAPTATASPTPETGAPSSPSLGASPVESLNKPRPTVVAITGRVRDEQNNPMANVVVVLISPQGTVLASTTDVEGNYSFTVAASDLSYRLIPSKDGFVFEPVDKLLPSANEDRKSDFMAKANRAP